MSRSRLKVALVATHPIQYHVPWYQAIEAQGEVDLKVYFALLPDEQQQGVGFGVPFRWDIPMFDGYAWEVLPNTARDKRLTGFFNSSTPGILSVLRAARPDVVLITGWNALPLLQGLLAALRLGIPAVVRAESNSLKPRPAWVRLAHRFLLGRFRAFLAIGKANEMFYLAGGVDPSRIFPCRYFVDNDSIRGRFDAMSPHRANLRDAWNVPPAAFCFLYVGKLEPKKRILDLLDALRIATRSDNQLHLLVVGTGELLREAQAIVEEHALPVTFAGFLNQTELPRAYVAGDCLVLPSDFGETWGLVVNEAMVCGLPAIVSDRVGCGPDLVSPGETGLIFPCGDAAHLARHLLEMASHGGALARKMGRQARDRVAGYSVSQAAEGTVRALRFAASRP